MHCGNWTYSFWWLYVLFIQIYAHFISLISLWMLTFNIFGAKTIFRLVFKFSLKLPKIYWFTFSYFDKYIGSHFLSSDFFSKKPKNVPRHLNPLVNQSFPRVWSKFVIIICLFWFRILNKFLENSIVNLWNVNKFQSIEQ